jgi:hypothetical protein
MRQGSRPGPESLSGVLDTVDDARANAGLLVFPLSDGRCRIMDRLAVSDIAGLTRYAVRSRLVIP